MPTYEYKCDACGHAFEQFQSITAVPIKKCPACKKSKVKRLIGTGAGLIFKGSGFYITDYRDQGYKDKAKAESGAGAASGNGDAKKSDAATTTNASDASKTESKAPAAAEAKPVAAAADKPKSKPKRDAK